MFATRRPDALLALAAITAAALTAACGNDPLGPSTSAAPPRAAKAPVANFTPHVAAPGMIFGHVRTLTADGKGAVAGATLRFSTDKGYVDVTDGGAGDVNLAGGSDVLTNLPLNSTSYKAQVVGVPIGFHVPTAAPVDGKPGTTPLVSGPTIEFPSFMIAPKKKLRIDFLDRNRKLLAGGTVVVTAPGFDLMSTLTDGKAGDQTPFGKQAPADGSVTYYVPGDFIGQFKVCEQNPPAGYAPASPSCVTVDNKSQLTSLYAAFVHDAGILAPAPSM